MIETDELERLIAAARGGDKQAEGELYKRYRRFVERRLESARRRRNWFWLTDLDDAIQDVFIQFYGALKKGRFEFKGEDELKGFLVKTSFFVVMNLKDKKPRERLFSSFIREDDEGNPVLNLAAFADKVYAHQERKDCLKMFYEAVDELSKNRRDVIMRTLLGQKVRDICAATRRSPASVSGLKFNGLKELKQKLEAGGFLEHCAEALEILGGKSDDG